MDPDRGLSLTVSLPEALVLAASASPSKILATSRGRYGERGRLIETNAARTAIFMGRADESRASPSWRQGPPVHGHPVEVLALRGLPTMRDLRVFVELTTAFAHAGYPVDRRVPFSAYDVCRSLGFASTGGRNVEMIKESLRRLSAIRIRQHLRVRRAIFETEWELIGRWQLSSQGCRGQGWVRLSEELSILIQAGSVTVFDKVLFEQILAEPAVGDLAGRLFLFLESEQGPGNPGGWNYTLLPVDSQPGKARYGPTLAELVGLEDHQDRRVRRKLVMALDVIQRVDPRYRFEFNPADVPTSVLVTRTSDSVGRQPRPRRVATSDPGGRGGTGNHPVTSASNVIPERRGAPDRNPTIDPGRQNPAPGDLLETLESLGLGERFAAELRERRGSRRRSSGCVHAREGLEIGEVPEDDGPGASSA